MSAVRPDAIIIGGGTIGGACALELARGDARRSATLDAARCDSWSGCSAGLYAGKKMLPGCPGLAGQPGATESDAVQRYQ
jgi:glycine/D-amino acid oxidase-like deaminating enzyme